MKLYQIKLEFCGKLLQLEVYADSIEQAKHEVLARVNFHAVTEIKKDDDKVAFSLIKYKSESTV